MSFCILYKAALDRVKTDLEAKTSIQAVSLGEAGFLTCDDEILDKRVCIENLVLKRGYRLKVRNPVNHVKERRRRKR
jgi:hypothetical protein